MLPCLGLLCGLSVLPLSAVPAAAQNVPVTDLTAPRIGWGDPIDGLQIGLFPKSDRTTYRYGDTITFLMRVKNVTQDTIRLNVKVPDAPFITLGEGSRLVIQSVGGEAQPLSLRPGEIVDLPGGHYDRRIVAPHIPLERMMPNAGTLVLLPGTYRMECSTPLWIPDADDAGRATAHRAKPGIFTFTVADPDATRSYPAPKHKPVPVPLRTPDRIHWGAENNGLQGGILLVTAKDREVLPPNQRADSGPNEMQMLYYVRNTGKVPISIHYALSNETDWNPWVKDAAGKDQLVHTTFVSGMRGMRDQVLAPGQIQQTGWASMKFYSARLPLDLKTIAPLLLAEPGHYTVRLVNSVRYTGFDNFDVVLVSGDLPFDIPAQ